MRWLIGLVVAWSLLGCAHAPEPPAPDLEAECRAQGGRLRPRRRVSRRDGSQAMSCNRPAPDVGKSCTDWGECASHLCIVDNDLPAGVQSRPHCFEWLDVLPLGCNDLMVNGRLVRGVCRH